MRDRHQQLQIVDAMATGFVVDDAVRQYGESSEPEDKREPSACPSGERDRENGNEQVRADPDLVDRWPPDDMAGPRCDEKRYKGNMKEGSRDDKTSNRKHPGKARSGHPFLCLAHQKPAELAQCTTRGLTGAVQRSA